MRPAGSCVDTFTVHLQSRAEGGVFVTGDIVRGYVTLELLQHLSLTTIRIAIKGRAFVHWTEQVLRGVGEPRYKDTHHHSAIEDYFDHSLVLFGQTKNDRPEKCYLPAGRYTYPFKYQLPPNLPSSFEGEFGYVRFWVKATIEKGREQCHVTQKPFTMVSPLDLNKVPDCNNPVQESTEKHLCCFCCISGPINAVLCLQKRGYVPGEPIKFSAEVSNFSSRKMSSYSVELKMTTIFKTPTKSRSVSRQICKTSRHSVAKGDTDSWVSDQLIVPPLPPSCLLGCSIISVKYTLELRVDPVGPAFDLTLPIEIVIGTIPHRMVHEHQYANAHHHQYQQPHPQQQYQQYQPHQHQQHHQQPYQQQPHQAQQQYQQQYHHPQHQQQPPPSLQQHQHQQYQHPQQQHQPSPHNHGTDAHRNERPISPSQRHVVGVQVLPVQGGHLIVNPAHHSQPSSNRVSNVSASSSERSHQSHQPPRPPSRTSSAPSTTSTLSSHQRQVSTVFLESPFCRMNLKFEDDGDAFVPERQRFAPVYPFYQWRR